MLRDNAVRSNSLPEATMNDAVCGRSGDRKNLRNDNLLDSFSVQFSDQKHLGGGKRQTANDSVLGGAVSHVIGLVSGKQMRGSKAGRVIASVKDKNPFGDRSVGLNPRSTVGFALTPAVLIDESVSLSISTTRPFKASITFWDRLQKGFQQFVVRQFGILHVRLACMGSVVFPHCGAFSILTQEGF
jgi:hypothetical protein